METASGSRLKSFFLRLAFYAAGLALIIALLLALAFSLARPKLLALAQRELSRQGLQARDLDMSLFGRVHIYDLSAPLKQGGFLRIAEISARPPLHFWGKTWLGSAGSLYDMRLEKGGVKLFIPQLSFSGAALEDKDPAITSRSLQMLKRLRAGSVYADKVDISLEKPGADGAEINAELHDFGLQGLSNGKISRLFYSSMGSGAAMESTPGIAGPAGGADNNAAAGGGRNAAEAGRRSNMQSGAFSAVNIDAAALYALARSLVPRSAGGEDDADGHKIAFPADARDLIGAVQLSNVNIDVEDDALGRLHIAAAELASGGLALKGDKSAADFITVLPAEQAAGAASGKDSPGKQIMLHNLRALLADMAAVDIRADAINIAAAPGPQLLAARAAAEAKAATDKALANAKTVNDVLNQTQQQDEQSADTAGSGDSVEADADDSAADAPHSGLGQQLKTLPLQFKLSLKSFALRADQWQQAIPHRFYVRLDDFIYLPGDNNNALLQALHDMGHENLQFSLLGDIAWNAGDSALAINRLAFHGRDMGGFSVQGKFLNIPQTLFDGRPEGVAETLNRAGIANMEIWLEDEGFIKNLVRWGTTQINISAAELQSDLHDIAVKSPPLLFRNRQEAQNFAKVFGAFVDDSGSVRIMMSAPQSGGLKLSDIMNSQEALSVVLDKLHLTADRPAQSAPLPD